MMGAMFGYGYVAGIWTCVVILLVDRWLHR